MDEPKRKRRPIPGVTDDLPRSHRDRPRKKNSREGHLTAKQQLFIREYQIDQNAAAAARRAGYSESVAQTANQELLKHPIIASEISRLFKEKLKQTELSADGVLAKMKALTSGDIRDIFDVDGNLLHPRRLPESIATRIAAIKVRTERQPSDDPEGAAEVVFITEIKLWGMDVQLTNLAKAFAMFSDKPAGNVTITIEGGLPDDDFSSEPIPDIVSGDVIKEPES